MLSNRCTRFVGRILAAITFSTVIAIPHFSRAAVDVWAGTGADMNWSTPGNWLGSTPPGTSDDVKFNDDGGSGVIGQVDNIVDITRTNLSLQFAATNSAAVHTTQINPGVTLALTGPGGLVNGNEAQNDTRVTDTITGVGGTLIVSNTAAVINVRQPASVATANRTTLDMSGLDTFTATVARLMVGVATNNSTFNRATGRLLLARTNTITTSGSAPQVDVSDSVGSSNNGMGSTLSLGQTNVFFTDSIGVGRGRESAATFNFNAAFSTPGVFIRGTNGLSSRVTTWIIGDAATQTGTITARGTVNLSAGVIDAMIDSLTLGQPSLGSNDGSQSQGTFTMGTGTLDVNTLTLGNTRTNNKTSASATLNLTGSTLIVNSNLVLTKTSGGIAGITNTATLNATSSTLAVNTITNAGDGTNTINLASSTLILTNTAGSAAQPIGRLSIADSTLQLNAVSGAPAITVNNLQVNGSSDIINISSAPGIGQFPLIVFTSLGNELPDFTIGTLPAVFQGYISNNTSSVDLVITNTTIKTDSWRGNLSGDWDTATLNWFANGHAVAYAQIDPVVFDDTLTGTANVNLTTVLTPPSVTANNSGEDYVFSGAGKLSGPLGINKSGTKSLTLSETGGDDFTGPISVNGGKLILDNANSAITGAFSIANGAALQIGNNDANGSLPVAGVANNGSFIMNRSDNVVLATSLAGSGALVKLGNGTLTLSNANTYTGDTAVFHGTLALAGATTISSSANVVISNSTFDVSGTAGPSTLANFSMTDSTLTIGTTNLQTPLNVSTMSMAGSGNTIHVTALPPFVVFPATITLVQSTFGIGGFSATATLPAGFTGTVQLSPDNLAIQLTINSGPTGLRPYVSWSGADVPNLNTNWSDNQNWQLPGAPVAGDNVIFNNNGAQTAPALSSLGGGINALTPDFIDNIVDQNFTLSSLVYTNFGSAFHNTFIQGGRTLSITNTQFNIGALDTGSTIQTEVVTIAGTNATLSVNNTNANVQVYLANANTSSTGNRATLDLSALDNFNATAGRFLVGSATGSTPNRPSGILYLARTNHLIAAFATTNNDLGSTPGNAAIDVADCNANAGADSSLYLGLVNTISADTITIGRQKASGHFLFNPLYANVAPYPTVTIGGYANSRISFLEIGNSAANSGTTTLTADALLNGGFVNASVDVLNVGRGSGATSGGGTTTGTLNFDAGTIDVNTLNIGLQPTNGIKAGVGFVGVSTNSTIGTAARLVAGTINLGLTGGGGGATNTAGTLNITNATVTANSIVTGTNSVSTINLIGGNLTVSGTIASAGAPLSTLTLASLNTPDNSNTVVQLSAALTPNVVVTNLNIDGLDSTTNRINISSVAPVTAPAELPLIKYTTLSQLSGSTFNLGLGTLPAGYTGYLTNDTTSSAIALVVLTAPAPVTTPPTITKITISGGNVIINGSNNTGSSSSYHLLSSTNVSLPLSNWTVVSSGSFDNGGNLSISTPVDATKARNFYILQVP